MSYLLSRISLAKRFGQGSAAADLFRGFASKNERNAIERTSSE